MDISWQFRVCVDLRTSYQYNVFQLHKENSSHHLEKKSSCLITRIKMISLHIFKLYSVLIHKRSAYTELNQYNVKSKRHCENDCVTKSIINTNFHILMELKNETIKNNSNQQNREHLIVMITIIEIHLKNVCRILAELQNVRFMVPAELTFTKTKLSCKKNSNSLKYNVVNSRIHEQHQVASQKFNNNVEKSVKDTHKYLSSEDIQIYEIENEHIFSELNIFNDEIDQIENRVVRIHELQEIFMEKVITQDKNLENLLLNVVGSTQNVREANEQIRKAIQSNAGLRVWVLFFLLVMSFTLIFLDWYNH
ncbi:syntaxin-18 [Copidosoma floridanum]|uniref:syntaxin-18 n=1 Tax=Copidosoma floridanum TaxID=29053 RepID=UPI0006C9A92A|nr:syntaxin-18 [Copidosoma floridanum]